MSPPQQQPPPTPPEIHFDERWDRLVDTTLRRVVYGGLAGAAVAVALCRGPVSRTFAVAWGAGWGAGSAWTTCSQDVSADRTRRLMACF